MCLIITSESGEMSPTYVLEHAFRHNPHGWGIVYFDGQTAKVDKGMRLQAFLDACRRVEGMPFILHLRYATHGQRNRANTHPFKLTDGSWLAHNGIIKIDCPDKRRSDTYHFAQLLSACIDSEPFGWSGSPEMIAEVGEYIGRNNKLAVMQRGGRIYRVNEAEGEWIDGLWYSNTYSLPISYGSSEDDLATYQPTDETDDEDVFEYGWSGWSQAEMRELERRYCYRTYSER